MSIRRSHQSRRRIVLCSYDKRLNIDDITNLNKFYELLTEIVSLEQPDERGRRVFEPDSNALAILKLAFMYKSAEFFQCGLPQIQMIGTNETAQLYAVDEKGPEIAHCQCVRIIVTGDQAAQGNSRKRIHMVQNCVENAAADVIEIDIHAARARGLEPGVERAGLIVDARIEPEFVHDVITFRPAAGDTNRSTAFELGELANDAADRTACCR